jgi:hypothetical protein
MSHSHADLKAGLVKPSVIENGVVVEPNLQIGVMTLREHQEYLIWMKMQKPLTRNEAIAAGHRPSEIYEYFGPLDPELTAGAKPFIPLALTTDKLDAYVELPSPKRLAMEGFRQLNEGVPSQATQFAESLARGYTGDCCPDCGMFTMLHNGTCLVCDNCGRTTGCS